MDSQTENPQQIEAGRLAEAFRLFSQASEDLAGAYTSLQEQVAGLTAELALANGRLKQEIAEKTALTERLALLLDALPALGLTAIAPPDGAFYIYADIGHLTNDSMAFCEKLLRDTGVVAAPGIDHDPVDGRRFIRFSFAVSTDLAREAIARLIPWFAAQGGQR